LPCGTENVLGFPPSKMVRHHCSPTKKRNISIPGGTHDLKPLKVSGSNPEIEKKLEKKTTRTVNYCFSCKEQVWSLENHRCGVLQNWKENNYIITAFESGPHFQFVSVEKSFSSVTAGTH
jgi:hypothetical protein